MGTCATIREQYSMKTVIVEMTMVPKRLMTMALQKNNRDEFVYVILLRFNDLKVHYKMYFKTCFVPIFDRFV